jgi:hypothetical protein
LVVRGLNIERKTQLMRLISVIVVLATLALSGCKDGDTNVNSNGNGNANKAQSFKPPQPIKPTQPVDANFKPCNPYFPLVPGSIAKYVLNYSSGLVADLTVVVDVADEDGRKVFTQRSQLIDRSGGLQIAQLITRKFVCDGEKVQILSEKTESNLGGQQSSSVDFDYREDSLMMPELAMLSRKGSTWSHAFRSVIHKPGEPPTRSDEPTIIKFEVAGPEDVTTAAGNFKAIKIIRTVMTNGTTDYYVAGIGLVRRFAKEGTSTDLKEYSGLAAQD